MQPANIGRNKCRRLELNFRLGRSRLAKGGTSGSSLSSDTAGTFVLSELPSSALLADDTTHRFAGSDPYENAFLIQHEAKKPQHCPDHKARDNRGLEWTGPGEQPHREGPYDLVKPLCPSRVRE